MKSAVQYALVTGASRGIGLEFTRQLLSDGYRVLAVARNPEASELAQLKLQHADQLMLLTADLEDPNAPEMIRNALASWPRLDLLINNAGILLREEKQQDLLRSFQVNAIAPWLLVKALKAALQKSPAPKAIQISSQMGSIADNLSGGHYAYRSSKAALNMLVKSLAMDERWLIAVVMHPGWVQTRMGGEGATISTATSVRGMLKIIHGLQASDSGSFLNYNGATLAW
jgi:NAD(P)-dependent dehydrogenase (short-subunit alcohol dehydrogenase family)